jgi:hypothetical protein
MNALLIASTEHTPAVDFSPATGILEISGRSIPEDARGFYSPVMAWLKAYQEAPHSSTVLLMKLEYFNTASSKILLDVLNSLEHLVLEKKVVWHYDRDDEGMLEAGQEFSQIVNIPFEYKVN